MAAAEPEGLFLVVPLASMRRQRAKYSSSVGGFSVLDLFVLFLLVHGSTQWWSTVSSWWSSGGAEVGEFNVSRAIQERFFNGELGLAWGECLERTKEWFLYWEEQGIEGKRGRKVLNKWRLRMSRLKKVLCWHVVGQWVSGVWIGML